MTEHWISAELMQRLAGSLLHFFWQGALVAMIAAISLRLLARRSPESRYAVAVTALIIMMVAPVLTFVFYVETGGVALSLLKFAGRVLADSGRVSEEVYGTRTWTQWIVAAWISGVVACSVRLAAGWRVSHRLLQTSSLIVPFPILRMFEDIRHRLAFRKPIPLLVSAFIDTPAVVGWIKPVVLLPVSAISGLSEIQLQAVFAHELAHIRRHDFLVNMLQRAVESVLFYHPAVWWLSNRIRTEREHCCDDHAVRICGDRLLYAEALIELESQRPASPALVVAAVGSGLSGRVRRILGRETNQDWRSAGVALLFVLTWLIGGMWQSKALHAEPEASQLAAILLPVPSLASPFSGTIQSIAAIMTAQPLEPAAPPEPMVVSVQSGTGNIEGMVTIAGSTQPVFNAQVTLSGGAIKSETLERFSETLWESAMIPPEDVMIGFRTYLMNSKGMAQPAAQQAADKIMNEGLPASPDNGGIEDVVLQNIMRFANVNFGNSPYNSELGAAIRGFRATNAQFKGVSDRSGRFTFSNVPAGNYTVRVERDGYYGTGGAVPQTASANVKVGVGQTASASVSMIKGSTISGHLRDDQGLPIANATVQAFAVAYSNGLPALRAAASGKTNDRGEYSIFWLPGGPYLVASVRDSTQIVGGMLLQQVVGTFYPGTSIVTDAIPINVKPGDNLEGIDFVNRSPKAVKVSGTIVTTIPPPPPPQLPAGVVNPAAAAANPANQNRNAVLMLLQRNPAAPDDIGARQVGNVPVNVVKATGTFEVELAPGSYDLYGRMPGGPGAPVNVTWGRVSFDVRDEPVKDLVIKVEPTPPIKGTLTVNGKAPEQNGIKVSMQVDDSAAKLPAYGLQIRARTVPVDPAGVFTIPAIWVGHWQLFAEGLSSEMYVSDVRQGGTSVFDTGVTVTGGEEPTPLQVSIRTDSGTIQGSVVDVGKRPVPGASVVIAPPDSRRQNRLLYRTATADENGRFVVRGVAPGIYKIFSWRGGDSNFFSNPIDGAYYNTAFLSRYESRGQSASVAQNAATDVEVMVIPEN